MQNQRLVFLLKAHSCCWWVYIRLAKLTLAKTSLFKRGFYKIQLVDKLFGTEQAAVFYTTDFCQHSCAGQDCEEVLTLPGLVILTEAISKYVIILTKHFFCW